VVNNRAGVYKISLHLSFRNLLFVGSNKNLIVVLIIFCVNSIQIALIAIHF
jgi:hypothetical protein